MLALGLKKETADCHFEGRKNLYEEWEVIETGGCIHYKDFPAWSLHRLIEMCTIGMRVPSILLYSNDVYDNLIGYIEELIRYKSFNKEYLKE